MPLVPFGDKRPRVHPSAFIDPGARLAGDVEVGPGCAVLFGAILRGDDEPVRVLEGSVILEQCLVEAPEGHPVSIGPGALISHRATIHGAVVEEGALVGIGAIVLDGAVVGREAIVGAGAVVLPGTVVEPGTLVVGVPAKVARRVTEQEVNRVKREIEKVLRKAEVYRAHFEGPR